MHIKPDPAASLPPHLRQPVPDSSLPAKGDGRMGLVEFREFFDGVGAIFEDGGAELARVRWVLPEASGYGWAGAIMQDGKY